MPHSVYLTGFMSSGESAQELEACIGEKFHIIKGIRDGVYSLTNYYDELREVSQNQDIEALYINSLSTPAGLRWASEVGYKGKMILISPVLSPSSTIRKQLNINDEEKVCVATHNFADKLPFQVRVDDILSGEYALTKNIVVLAKLNSATILYCPEDRIICPEYIPENQREMIRLVRCEGVGEHKHGLRIEDIAQVCSQTNIN